MAVSNVSSPALRGSNSKDDAVQYKKAFGDKTIGDVANAVSDPKFENSKTKMRGVGSPELGRDAFFKLMMTQLKNQDPTSPLKSHEMAAQLAQFSSLEQMSNMNTTLEKLDKGQNKSEQFQILNLIGKKVGGDSSTINRLSGDKEHNISFKTSDNAEKVFVKISDSKGKVIKEYSLNDIKKGQNKIAWNGLYENGQEAPVGDYRVEIDAQGANGKKLTTDMGFEGTVTGVKYSKNGPLLLVDDLVVPLVEVKNIKINETKPAQEVSNIIKKDNLVSHGALASLGDDGQGLDNVAMSSELKGKLIK